MLLHIEIFVFCDVAKPVLKLVLFMCCSWAEEDVDPSLFPRELLANASNFVGDEEVA